MEILGIDIGGSGVKAALVDIDKGELLMVDFNPAIGNYCNDGGLTFLMPGATDFKKDTLVNSHKILKKTIKTCPKLGPKKGPKK